MLHGCRKARAVRCKGVLKPANLNAAIPTTELTSLVATSNPDGTLKDEPKPGGLISEGGI